MLDTRQTLTAFLQASTIASLVGDIVQEDEFGATNALPALIIAFAGDDPYNDTLFRRENWDIWIVSEKADYYTLGLIAKELRKLLDREQVPYVSGSDSTVLGLQWISGGSPVFDREYGVHAIIQSYIATVFDVA